MQRDLGGAIEQGPGQRQSRQPRPERFEVQRPDSGRRPNHQAAAPSSRREQAARNRPFPARPGNRRRSQAQKRDANRAHADIAVTAPYGTDHPKRRLPQKSEVLAKNVPGTAIAKPGVSPCDAIGIALVPRGELVADSAQTGFRAVTTLF